MSDLAMQARDAAVMQPPRRQSPVRYSLVLILIALVVTFSLLRPDFADAGNVSKILRSASISGIMFLGVTWVIASGEIDISFMEVAALADMLAAGLVHAGHGWPLACAVGLASGVGVGVINGVLVGYLRLPALITTLATGGFARSMAAVIGAGSSLEIGNAGFVGRFLDTSFGFFPAVGLLTIALYGIAWFVQERLVFGHYLYAMEQNRNAIVEAGVPARRLPLRLYLI